VCVFMCHFLLMAARMEFLHCNKEDPQYAWYCLALSLKWMEFNKKKKKKNCFPHFFTVHLATQIELAL
jgi:hypothetical protein